MHEFAEEYVANLKPREERYDTRLGDDFYVATFPNGIKTWIYLYTVNEFARRQTLGVYPEMPLAVALEALYAARRTRSVEAQLAEQGLDGSQVRDVENSPININTSSRKPRLKVLLPSKKFLGGALTGVAAGVSIAVVAWMFLAQAPDTGMAKSAAAAAPVAPAGTSPAQTAAAVKPDSVPAAPAVASGSTSAAEGVAIAAAPDKVPPEIGESQRALMRMQQDLAGTLAWAQLTSGVKNGEPVDQLGWIVELQEKKPRRVFFFVRVRGMEGDTVTYRWSHEGQLLKEDEVRVGRGWHSPAYSGITLTHERLGVWHVEVMGPDGDSLGSEQFEARTVDPALLSLR